MESCAPGPTQPGTASRNPPLCLILETAHYPEAIKRRDLPKVAVTMDKPQPAILLRQGVGWGGANRAPHPNVIRPPRKFFLVNFFEFSDFLNRADPPGWAFRTALRWDS